MKNSMQHCCLKMSCQVPSSTKNIELDMHFCRICAYMAKLKRVKFTEFGLLTTELHRYKVHMLIHLLIEEQKALLSNLTAAGKKLDKSGEIHFNFPLHAEINLFYWFHPNASLCICRRWDDMDHSYVVHFSVISAFYREASTLNDDQRKCRCLELILFKYQWYNCLNINCCFIIDVRFENLACFFSA